MKNQAMIIMTIITMGLLLNACNKTEATEAPAVASANEQSNDISNTNQMVKAKGEESASTKTNGFDSKPTVGTKAVCPVMGGAFTVSESTEMSEYNGKFYAFCCPGCKPQFDADPKKYI